MFEIYSSVSGLERFAFGSYIGSVNMEALMANTMSTDCFRKKMNTILKQFLTSLLLLTSNITTIVDVRHGTWITTNLSSYATL